MRCFVFISGRLIAAPIKLEPAMYIPNAAPNTENPQQAAIPSEAQITGFQLFSASTSGNIPMQTAKISTIQDLIIE
jgi:hypothetical protein